MNERDVRQTRVGGWVVAAFGQKSNAPTERAMRLLEETLELAQAENIPRELAMRMVNIVYSRPVGDPKQEIGGVQLCVLAYCDARNFNADEIEGAEIARVLSADIERYRRRQNEKQELGVSVEGIKAK